MYVNTPDLTKKLYISTFANSASETARAFKVGLEIGYFTNVSRLEHFAVNRPFTLASMAGIQRFTLHAPYDDLAPAAGDPLFRSATMQRFEQTASVMGMLGILRGVFHSGYYPSAMSKDVFVDNASAFWQEYLESKPFDFTVMIENVYEPDPEILLDLLTAIGDPRVWVCLNIDHACAYSKRAPEDWIRVLDGRISHVHVNGGQRDLFSDNEELAQREAQRMRSVLEVLLACAPDASICLQTSEDASIAMDWLKRNGYLSARQDV